MSLPDSDYLRTQAELVFPKELRQLAAFGVRDGHSILELGCGPGWVTRALLDTYPRSGITALDRDSAMLTEARERVRGAAAGRARFLQASVERTGLAPASFDVAYARFVFHHVGDPALAAAEALRVLRPGGLLVVTGGDDALFGLTTPEVAEMRSVLDRVADGRARKGGNRFRGRQLGPILAGAGFERVAVAAVTFDSVEAGLEQAVLPLRDDHLRRLVAEGLLSEEEARRGGAARERFLAHPGAYGLRIVLMACGCKPAP